VTIIALGIGRLGRHRDAVDSAYLRYPGLTIEALAPAVSDDISVLTERAAQESLDIVLGAYALEYRWDVLGEEQRNALVVRIRNQAEFVNGVLTELTGRPPMSDEGGGDFRPLPAA
jgi:hypothetical protein